MITTTRSLFPAFTVSPVRGLPRRVPAVAPTWNRVSFGPSISSAWTDEGLRLTVDLPGVPDEAVAVSVAGPVLSIEVSTDELSWSRQLRLPAGLDAEQVDARYTNGRLTVTVARTAAPESRRIAIDTTPEPKALATDVTETVEGDVEPQADSGEGTSVTG